MRVFISYSHDSTEHERRVRAFADQLRADGIDAWIDQYVQDPDEGWIKWMRTQVKQAEKVLLVFTETYQRRFEGDEEAGKGLGATFEGVIVTQSLYESGGRNAKFRPVVFREGDERFIPLELRRFNRYRADTPERYQNLLRWLHNAPRIVPPEVRQKPDLPTEPILELFPIESKEPPVSAVASLPEGAEGAAVPQPALPGISKTAEIVEGVLSFDGSSRRRSVLLTPPFLDKPEITLVAKGWSAEEDPVIEAITTDKFTVKISSSNQYGEWIWRARGPRRDEKVGPQVGPSHSITPSAAGPSMPANVVSNSPLSEPVDEAISSTEAKEKAGAKIGAPNGQPNITEAVLLIHGIRDFAEWQDVVSNVLAEIPNTEIYPLKYGRFDALRFWFPLWTREAPVRKLLWRIRSARDRFSTAKLSGRWRWPPKHH
jgi:hypothetical protein